MSLKQDYERVIGRAWDIPYDQRASVVYEEAVRYCKVYWRRHTRRTFPYDVKETSGNRETWVRNGVLYINPNYWDDINHSWSHWVSYVLGNENGHCDAHLELERDGAYLIREMFLSERREVDVLTTIPINNAGRD